MDINMLKNVPGKPATRHHRSILAQRGECLEPIALGANIQTFQVHGFRTASVCPFDFEQQCPFVHHRMDRLNIAPFHFMGLPPLLHLGRGPVFKPAAGGVEHAAHSGHEQSAVLPKSRAGHEQGQEAVDQVCLFDRGSMAFVAYAHARVRETPELQARAAAAAPRAERLTAAAAVVPPPGQAVERSRALAADPVLREGCAHAARHGVGEHV